MHHVGKAAALAVIAATLTGAGTTTAFASPSDPTCGIVAAPRQPTRTDGALVAEGTLRCDGPVGTLSISIVVTNLTTGAVVSTATEEGENISTVSARTARPCASFTGPYYRATFTGYSDAGGERRTYATSTHSSPYCGL